MKFKTTQDSFKKKNNATKFIIFSTTRNQGFTIYKKKKAQKSCDDDIYCAFDAAYIKKISYFFNFF